MDLAGEGEEAGLGREWRLQTDADLVPEPRAGDDEDDEADPPVPLRSRRARRAAPGLGMRVVGNRYGAAGLILLALLATYGAAELSRPSRAAAPVAHGSTRPVQAAVVSCPVGYGARTTTVALPSSERGGLTDMRATLGGTPVSSLNGSGTAWTGPAAAPLTVRATGAPAAGLEAEQSISNRAGDDKGLAAVRCTEPGTDLWFLGPGPVAAKQIQLYLSNVDQQPASVDLEALSDNGPLDTTDGRGISVDPQTSHLVTIGQSSEGLGSIVGTARVLALHVHVTVGRVAAAVKVRTDKGKGLDWVPMATAPSNEVVVPGIPGGTGQRQLMIAVPGQADAKVKLQVITPEGAYAPGGQDTLAAPARSVATMTLDGALSGKPAAIRLVADRPILAGFSIDQGDDMALGTATPPLVSGGPAGAVAENRSGGGADSTILLSAPGKDAAVRLTAITAQGVAGSPQDVKVGAGRTLQVRPSAPAGSAEGFSIMISPLNGSGPVYAGRILTVNGGISVLPVFPTAGNLSIPPVTGSLTALVP